MKILYGTGFQAEDRKQQVPVMHSNALTSIKTLIVAADEMDVPIEAEVR
jgi:hypothetical protein